MMHCQVEGGDSPLLRLIGQAAIRENFLQPQLWGVVGL
jgi:hypothetical protein